MEKRKKGEREGGEGKAAHALFYKRSDIRDTHLEIFEERRISSPVYLRKQILIEHFAH